MKKAGRTDVKAYACHPGSSRTSLISTSGSLMMRIIFALMKLSPLTQPSENGAYPQLMCATEEDLDQSSFYGPTGRSNWVGNILLKPNKSISEVAYELGFEYPQYFSRLFKKKVGVSPSVFRNSHLLN